MTKTDWIIVGAWVFTIVAWVGLMLLWLSLGANPVAGIVNIGLLVYSVHNTRKLQRALKGN